MLELNLYVHASAYIAPDSGGSPGTSRLAAQEPDYGSIIQPMQLRRMSKAVRMAIGAANECLQSSGATRPDAIIVGTTTGCLNDTEMFLKKMVVQAEEMLTPTSFIQSTHNTIAGQIALLVGCKGYNTTISQHGHSFEGALTAAALYLAENPGVNMLCGGADELTDTSYHLMRRFGLYGGEDDNSKGAVAGEGAGFLMLNKERRDAKACIEKLLVFSEEKADAAFQKIEDCLQSAGGLSGEDGLWLGMTGDKKSASVYRRVLEGYEGTPVVFKEQNGEWGTGVATALCRLAASTNDRPARTWIINHYCDDWSIWLVGQ